MIRSVGRPFVAGSPKQTRAAPTNRPAPRRLLSRLLTASCLVYLAVVVLLWLLLAWADLWWTATLLLFSPRVLFVVPLFVLLPFVLLSRRPRLLLPLGLAGLLAAGPLSGGRVPWRVLLQEPAEGMRFRVLTCNMHYGRYASGPLEDLVRDADPDVVALQEWDRHNHSEYLTASGWYTHRLPHLFLASRHRILQVSELGRDSIHDWARSTRYELETPTGAVTLFNLHLASPREGIYETVHQPETGTAVVEDNAALRWRQSRLVAGAAAQASGPVLLVGDFNTPPESAIFRSVWQRYTDAFSEAGWGWGYTFYGSKTAVRIDHILAGPGRRCRRCWVGPSIGSPHKPVVADLVWQGPE